MELRHLKTFAAAAELQSFTRAAEVLGLTQAAVSQHVAALEKELKVALFDRSGRSAKTTEAGRRLYEYARRILDLLEEARRTVSQLPAGEVAGEMRIAASTVPAETLLPDLLMEFRRRCPRVREELAVSDSSEATAAVEAGRVDLGFVGELPRSSRLSSRPVARDELVLVVGPGHALAERKRRRLSLKQLAEHPLLVREPGSGSRRCVEHALDAAGLPPDRLSVAMEINSNDAIRAAVERGVGAAFLSLAAVRRDVEQGRLVQLTVEGLDAHRQLYLLTDPRRIPSPAVRAFLAFLDDWLGGRRGAD